MTNQPKKSTISPEVKALASKGGSKSGGKKSRKLGRDKKDCLRYRLHQTREKYKLRNIFRSNGTVAAEKYAIEHGMLAFYQTRFRKLIDKRKVWKIAPGA